MCLILIPGLCSTVKSNSESLRPHRINRELASAKVRRYDGCVFGSDQKLFLRGNNVSILLPTRAQVVLLRQLHRPARPCSLAYLLSDRPLYAILYLRQNCGDCYFRDISSGDKRQLNIWVCQHGCCTQFILNAFNGFLLIRTPQKRSVLCQLRKRFRYSSEILYWPAIELG
jgi:hypothetical protein